MHDPLLEHPSQYVFGEALSVTQGVQIADHRRRHGIVRVADVDRLHPGDLRDLAQSLQRIPAFVTDSVAELRHSDVMARHAGDHPVRRDGGIVGGARMGNHRRGGLRDDFRRACRGCVEGRRGDLGLFGAFDDNHGPLRRRAGAQSHQKDNQPAQTDHGFLHRHPSL